MRGSSRPTWTAPISSTPPGTVRVSTEPDTDCTRLQGKSMGVVCTPSKLWESCACLGRASGEPCGAPVNSFRLNVPPGSCHGPHTPPVSHWGQACGPSEVLWAAPPKNRSGGMGHTREVTLPAPYSQGTGTLQKISSGLPQANTHPCPPSTPHPFLGHPGPTPSPCGLWSNPPRQPWLGLVPAKACSTTSQLHPWLLCSRPDVPTEQSTCPSLSSPPSLSLFPARMPPLFCHLPLPFLSLPAWLAPTMAHTPSFSARGRPDGASG